MNRYISKLTAIFTLALFIQGCAPAKSMGQTGRATKTPAGNSPGPAPSTPSPQDTNTPGPVVPVKPTDLPPPGGLPAPQLVPGASLAFDMGGTLSRSAPTSAVLRLVVQGQNLKASKSLRLTAQIYSLRNSTTPVNLDKLVTPSAGGVVDITIADLQPETVYRITKIAVADAQNSSLQASVKDPYFMATSGASPLSVGRRFITLRALNEAYLWDHDLYDQGKRYADYSGWCDKFYTWAGNGAFSVKPSDYAPNWFSNHAALTSASSLADVASKESITGDMIRYDGMFLGNHTFMIVSFDQANGKLWTIEGNFNRRVERQQRAINSAWKLGHLTQKMLRPQP